MKCYNCDKPAILTKTGKQSKFCSLSCRSKFNSKNTIEKRKATNIERYGVDNPSKNKDIISSRDITNTERYGTTNPFSLPEVQAKQQATMLERYGSSFATQISEFKEKQTDTWKATYGCHPWANPTIRSLRDQTMIERYGTDVAMKSHVLKEKARSTNLEKYGYTNPMLSKEVQEKLSTSLLGSDVFNKLQDKNYLQTELDSYSPTELSTRLGIHYKTLCSYLRKHELYDAHKSSLEREITSLLDANNISYICNNRTILKPYELDIYVPSLNKAIECNGAYWHSELRGRGRFYHLDKLEKCRAQGVDLFFIWDYIWYNNNKLIKNRLLNYLGLVETKVYARNCVIQNIDVVTKRNFLNENHLQGDVGSTENIGLFYKDELVSVMTFSKSRYNSNFNFELLRFCSKCGLSVVGAASKMFKYFTNIHKLSTIVSYSDNQYGAGNLYDILGFTKYTAGNPSYRYTKNYVDFENRVKYQKHKLPKIMDAFDPRLTEWENMKNNGYDRIWDCGSSTWHYIPDQ